MTQQDFEKLLKDILKYYKKDVPSIPVRVLDVNTEKIAKIYYKTYKSILGYLVEQLRYNGDSFLNINIQTQYKLMQQIETAFETMNVQVQEELEDYVNKQYINGQLNHFIATTGITDFDTILKEFPLATINFNKANQLISDTMEDLLFATDNTKKSLKKVIRETVSKHLQLNALTGESYDTIRRLIIKDLQKQGLSKTISQKGFVGVVDRGGKKWNLNNYADMVVQTKTHQAYIEGLKDHSIETGDDLAIIPIKGAKDHCKNFEGMIISLTGATKGFATYDQLKATNLIFHPRCRHNVIPIRESVLTDEDKKIHNDKLKNLKKISNKIKK